jgi:glycosyltransferase involved in cell wall biosynthesis
VHPISIVLPVFNREKVVARAIDSVLEQSLTNFELIVVDDGSSDATAAAIGRYGDPRIRMIRMPRNAGACAARNRGIEAATGEIVCFLDSDDVYFPEKLESVRTCFDREPALALLVDSFRYHKVVEPKVRMKIKQNPPDLTGAEFRTAVFERRIAKATAALSVRRRVLLEVGGFDERLRRRQDLDLVLRISRAHVCRTTDQILWEKRESADAISRDHRLFLQASIDICERHPEYLGENPGALYRDLRSHFASLAKRGHWRAFVLDARCYARYAPFEYSLLQLLLDSRVSTSGAPASIQRMRAESGSPSRIAEVACAPASVE